MDEIIKLKLKANEIRQSIIKMVYTAKSGHPGGSLSAVDIITVLYFKELNIDPQNPQWEDRDRFVLSKGHATPALYSALAMRGYFDIQELLKFRQIGSMLQGHPSMHVPGVDMATGSLGQGLSSAIGMALNARIWNKGYKVFAMIGDGECDEGSIWEAALFAASKKLSNLIVFLDRNMYQLDGGTENILRLGDLEQKWRAFDWNVITIDGHDIEQILEAVKQARKEANKPTMIVAHTIKGKGVSYMENTHAYHGKPPENEQDFKKAMEELEMERNKYEL
ncbi:MAG: transketolase [Thermoplasmata archaeon]